MLSPRLILTIALNDLAVYLKKPAAVFWTFLGPCLCMWLFGYITPTEPGLAPVTIVSQGSNSTAARKAVQSLRNHGHSIFYSELPAHSGLSVEFPSSAPVRIYAGPTESSAERLLRYELAAGALTDDPSTGKHNYGFQRTVPAYLIMFLTMNVLMSGATFAEERAAGRLRRLMLAPVRPVVIIMGRLASRLVVAWLQTIALFGIGVMVLRIRWTDHPIAVLSVLSAYTIAMGSVGILLGVISKNPNKAMSLAMWLAMLIAPLTGLWWPIEFMPKPVIEFSSVLPTSWVMRTVTSLLSSPDLNAVGFAATMGGLAIVAIVGTSLASRQLGKVEIG